MRMDPELEALGAELRRLGTTVVPHGDHLCIRLPYFTSVRVRIERGELRFAIRFGAASRDLAMFVPIGLLGTTSAALFASGAHEGPAVLAAVLGLFSAAFNIVRLILSEHAVTRVQTVRALQSRDGVHAPPHALNAAGAPFALPSPAGVAAPATPAASEPFTVRT